MKGKTGRRGRKHRGAWTVLALGCLLAARPASGFLFGSRDPQRAAVERAIGDVYPALVRIRVVSAKPKAGRLARTVGTGSGVIIHPDGYIITNHHVAGNARRLVCRMPDGEEIEAHLVGTDPLSDIAVIQLDLSKRKTMGRLPVARFGDSDRVQVGDTVLAMGSPGAVSQSVTKGIVSNAAMTLPSFHWPATFRLDGEYVGTLVRWIAHDATIFGGNSGGPLVNLSGEIVGINEIGFAKLGGAIPGNLARSVAEELIRDGRVRRSWTGIEAQPRLRGGAVEHGVLVGGVIEESPAAAAGVEPGDVLLSYDGVPVDCRIPDELPLFNARVLATPIGAAVPLVLSRGGQTRTVTLTTREREPARCPDRVFKDWGITARNMTWMSAMEHQRDSAAGVLISSARVGGPAGRGKPALRPGDVIREVEGTKLEGLDDLQAVTEKLLGERARATALVAFDRGTEKMLSAVTIGEDPKPERPHPVRKPWLPVALQVVTDDLARALGRKGLKGLRITSVMQGHAAEQAGLQVGDIIVRFDGEPIDTAQQQAADLFQARVRQYPLDAEVAVDILRDGKPRQVTVRLEAPAAPLSDLGSYEDDVFELSVRDLSLDDRVRRKLPDDFSGVMVSRVEPAGWALLAGLRSGDLVTEVAGEPVASVEDAERMLRRAAEDHVEQLVFFVRRGIHTMYIEIEPDWNGVGETGHGDEETEPEA